MNHPMKKISFYVSPIALSQVSCTPSLSEYVIYAILGASALAGVNPTPTSMSWCSLRIHCGVTYTYLYSFLARMNRKVR